MKATKATTFWRNSLN